MKRKSPVIPRKSGILSNGNNTPKHLTTQSSTALSVLTPTYGGSGGNTPSTSYLNCWPLASSSTEEQTTTDEVAELEVPIWRPNGSGNESSTSHLLLQDSLEGGSTSDYQRTRAAIEQTYQKIARTKELIKEGQTARDENVNEYLKLAASADKQQLQRIKSVFEKKNLKSAQAIAQLQKKLETYNKRIRDLETHGLSSSHWQPREVLRDVGQGLKDVGVNIKEGITGFSGGVVGNIKGGLSGLTQATHSAADFLSAAYSLSYIPFCFTEQLSKPREFAHLIKNRFGSADNISSLEKIPQESSETQQRNLHGSATFTHCSKYPSDDESSSLTSGSGGHLIAGSISSPRHQPLLQRSPPEHSSTPTVTPLVADLEPILQELRERREEYHHLVDEVEALKTQVQQEYTYFNQALHDERYRYERLEEQMNDLIELHQNEIENLKQGLGDMEEKVQYQSEERLRDVHEILDNCQTRISRMEHQQHQHFQQLVSLDSLDGTNARALALKLINVVLTVLQVVLLLVATVASILMPFIQTRLRILTTAGFIMSIVMLCRQWPELLDWGRHLVAQHVQT
ncbi:transmembrane and coiled-coil domains protein 2-like [Stegodyphus dumicola]|uniref:transmembrane and coiled-coil domains protein 2-like n=1 Tax=Stegodyphus dumicola TaxID=202533 RepID=UPI0015B0CAAF|nr:transmembrane and coiled-coil domains protein 2-like [Stegodyphus dumicola]